MTLEKSLHKSLKDPDKNRKRNIVLALMNLMTQIGEPKNPFEKTLMRDGRMLSNLYLKDLGQ